MTLHLHPEELLMVREILHRLVPGREVWAFGSRAGGTPRASSDLDLTVLGDAPLSVAVSGDLREAFTESALPFKVDVVDWAETGDPFRNVIRCRHAVIQAHETTRQREVKVGVIMKQTPLFERHRALGGRMVEFGGWEMPVQYPAGILAEHRQCREAAALFDTCHMGVFRLSGPTVGAALDAMLPRSVSGQAPGSCRYNFLVNAHGGVLDDLLTYRMDAGTFLLVVNAGTAEGDAAWLRAHLPPEVKFEDLREAWGKLDLQGPRAFEVLADLGVPVTTLPAYYHWMPLSLFGLEMLISRTGYTGERGVELYFPREQAARVWDRLLAHPLVKPAGLGARDTLRLEMGYPLYGHELNETTTPVEAGFGRLLNLRDRECIGATALRQPPARHLTGLRLASRRAARAGMTVIDPVSGQTLGTITSGAFSPNLGVAVALAYVAGTAPPAPGTPVRVTDPASGTLLDASVAPLPFYRQGTATT